MHWYVMIIHTCIHLVYSVGMKHIECNLNCLCCCVQLSSLQTELQVQSQALEVQCTYVCYVTQ